MGTIFLIVMLSTFGMGYDTAANSYDSCKFEVVTVKAPNANYSYETTRFDAGLCKKVSLPKRKGSTKS